MTAHGEAAVEVRDVSFSYGNETVLNGIDLTIPVGAFVAILGPNAGGKSTLLRIILGLLRPDRGTVRLFGEDPEEARVRVGYVPQYAAFNPQVPITAEEAVLMGLTDAGSWGFRYSGAERARARSEMEEMGVLGIARERMDTLSGGQRQRVMMARALVSEPELLIFDEPTSNVDPLGRTCFLELLEERRGKITVLIVSHDLSLAAMPLTGIACINRGLLYNAAPELTPEMLTMMYGAHGDTCPIGTGILDLADHVHPHSGEHDRRGHDHD